MLEDIEARLIENERERPVPLRRALFDVFGETDLKPGIGITKKMVSFELGNGERLLWEIENPANVFLHSKLRAVVEAAGFVANLRPYHNDKKDGGRHSALSRDWAFGNADCVAVIIDDGDSLRRLIRTLQSADAELVLDPVAVTRWIARLRDCFPTLDRFDQPDLHFDETERNYKLDVALKLSTAINKAHSDHEVADAVQEALTKSNLLQWRTYWAMTPSGEGDQERLLPALRAIVDAALGPPERHPEALEDFVSAWMDAVPKAKPDPARQIGEFLFLHLAPNDGIYIRHSVRQDLWQEAVGRRFPDHTSVADTYRHELRFMHAVRRAFEANGLAPRDMIDVQSALWVVHNYKEEGAEPLSRNAVEAAMDAFDAYRETGEPSAIFSAFGDPRDYWVRSTKVRPNRIYPSKPIVGYLRNSTKLSGGWGQKQDAAAQLHNAGYIIVDREGQPVAIPDPSDHLIPGAVRIRLCALNYYVEPARDSGAAQVSIRAGDLAHDMDLRDSFAAIDSALGGQKFQQLANVPAPTNTFPRNSSTTTFTYQLAALGGQEIMISEPKTASSTATNLILYGPPGTGKTYRTAWEAVRLCLGKAQNDPLHDDRSAVMAEYRRLSGEGRIEFITFHQSFSYEDFVEGLRPITDAGQDDDEDATQVAAGFSLKPNAGVFKTISEKARLDTGDAPVKRLDRTRSVYKIALGQRGTEEERIREGLDKSVIHLGWGEDIDWSGERFEHFEEFRKEWHEKKDSNASGKDPNIEISYAFRSGLQVGDYVVISDGRDAFRAFGRVTGEYYFDRNAKFHPHRRSVEWIWRDDNGAERTSFYARNFRRQSAYRLDKNLIDWDGLESVVLGADVERPIEGARPHVLIIDEINRGNISKIFGELITLLEVDKRLGCENEIKVRLPYSKLPFGVPSNLHIVATMNTADRSIALLDTALRRRFTFQELMPDHKALRNALAAHGLDSRNLEGINLEKLMQAINERIEYVFDREHQVGHAYFTGCRKRDDVEDVMRNKIIPLLTEYFYEDWSKVAVVLGDGEGTGRSSFLEAKRLTPPLGFDDAFSGDKVRWTLKDKFDFAEFKA